MTDKSSVDWGLVSGSYSIYNTCDYKMLVMVLPADAALGYMHNIVPCRLLLARDSGGSGRGGYSVKMHSAESPTPDPSY